MGEKNSSLTRVQPVFNALLDSWPDGDPWLGDLWEQAALTRAGSVLQKPTNMGRLLPAETPAEKSARMGKVFERTVAPPLAFLRWLLEHPEQMLVTDPASYGAKSEDAINWRRKLFSPDPELVQQAQAEGLARLYSRLGAHERRKWWLFEGFTRVDCCLITERWVVFVEGKRTELLSASTRWFQQRSQLWRNVEAGREFAGARAFGLMLAVETDTDGHSAITHAAESLVNSFPHLTSVQRAEMDRYFLGFITWPDIVTKFRLPPDCLIDRLA
jgi:hypothetical protein